MTRLSLSSFYCFLILSLILIIITTFIIACYIATFSLITCLQKYSSIVQSIFIPSKSLRIKQIYNAILN